MAENDDIKKEDAIKLLWDEYKMRYTNFWGLFNRFSLVILTISVVPYIKADVVKPLDEMILLFPIMAIFLTIACAWLLGAEYWRLDMVRRRYDKLVPKEYQREDLPQTNWWEKQFAKRIGTRMVIIFLVGFIVITAINFALIFYKKYPQ